MAKRWRQVRFDQQVEVKSYPQVEMKNYWQGLAEDELVEISSVETKKMKITIDSGAGVSVWPASWGVSGGETGRSFKDQTGSGERNPDQDVRREAGQVRDGGRQRQGGNEILSV